ncbi:DUF3515 domain-containing protein [Nocardioides sp. URHA0020]|uniref:DUF3515 domain-containing protein n=1 Tax=Nocardioides sp. URHA0020 TaxID=1380392 RepID=UPI0006846F2E|nr:DUF3515 domain-containing protein [Nocardioides sp. URHA0020]
MSDPARSRRPGSLWTRGVVACAVVLLATGCSSGPPEISTPRLSAAAAQSCRDLVADLPDRLADEDSVEVAGDTAYGAAWGDPAIVLTCGVAAVDLTDLPGCTEVDGIGWLLPQDEAGGDRDATFTADGYRPRVRLEVPEDYLPEQGAAALADLAPVLKRHLKLSEPCL